MPLARGGQNGFSPVFPEQLLREGPPIARSHCPGQSARRSRQSRLQPVGRLGANSEPSPLMGGHLGVPENSDGQPVCCRGLRTCNTTRPASAPRTSFSLGCRIFKRTTANTIAIRCEYLKMIPVFFVRSAGSLVFGVLQGLEIGVCAVPEGRRRCPRRAWRSCGHGAGARRPGDPPPRPGPLPDGCPGGGRPSTGPVPHISSPVTTPPCVSCVQKVPSLGGVAPPEGAPGWRLSGSALRGHGQGGDSPSSGDV